MNPDQLEEAVRATLRENVAGITAESLHITALESRIAEPRHRWLAPMLAAAAIVVVAGVSLGISIAIGSPRAGTGSAPAGYTSGGGSLIGEWRVVGARVHGSNVALDARPAITLTFQNDSTLAIDDGVNTTNVAIHLRAGSFAARFSSTTLVLDGSANNPRRHALLQLLDSIAPDTTPSASASNKYVIDGRHLTIQTSAGELRLAWLKPAVPAEPSASVTTSPAG